MNVSCAHLTNKDVDNRMCPLNLLESLTADYHVVKETSINTSNSQSTWK